MTMTTTTLPLELAAAAFGVLGTVLLALNGRRAGWGFVAYLVSNAGWIAFAWAHNHWGLLAQQIAFTGSSLLGVWVWLIKPRAAANTTHEGREASHSIHSIGNADRKDAR